ncbi:hypothetical protein HDV03_002877 [Kappamyces sp. JEL0829]|nr:hypothetical protein HDV03_002877 [Kappamyces sp. JEL0829]
MTIDEVDLAQTLNSNPEILPMLSRENPNSTIELQLHPGILEVDNFTAWLVRKREEEELETIVQVKTDAGKKLICELLSLPAPKLSPEIVNWLMEDGCLEYFVSKITMVPPENAFIWAGIQQQCRENTADPQDLAVAYKAAEILSSLTIVGKPLFQECQRRLVVSLCRLLASQSTGSLHHFKKVMTITLQRSAKAVDILLAEPVPELGNKIPIMLFLEYAVNSPVQDVIISCFLKITTKFTKKRKQDMSQLLRSCDFLGTLFQMLTSSDLEVARQSAHLLKRILQCEVAFSNQNAKDPSPSQFLLSDHLVADDSPFFAMIEYLGSSRRSDEQVGLLLDLIRSILKTRGESLDDVRNHLRLLLASRYSTLSGMFSSLSLIHQIELLDITTVLLSDSQLGSLLYEFIPWEFLAHSFFSNHHASSMFFVKFYELLCIAIQKKNTQSINALQACNFFNSLLEELYSKQLESHSDLRAFVRQIVKFCINDIFNEDSVVDFLTGHPNWDTIKVDL